MSQEGRDPVCTSIDRLLQDARIVGHVVLALEQIDEVSVLLQKLLVFEAFLAFLGLLLSGVHYN